MKLAVVLERELSRIFAIATIVVVVAVVTGLYLANLKVRDAAAHFISSHVKSLVESGVNTQSISDIDREVRRLHAAWTQAQNTDLRISVFIDSVLVGKAGQLPPFGWNSSATVEKHKLPSGQMMELKTETDFTRSSIREALLIAIFASSFFIGYRLLKRLIARNIHALTTPLEDRMTWLKRIAKHLPESVRQEVLPADGKVEEIVALDQSLNSFVQEILRLEARVKETGIKEGRVEMADRLAHALKGKLAVMRLRIENMHGLSVDEKCKLNESVNGLMLSSREMLESGRLGSAEKCDGFAAKGSGSMRTRLLDIVEGAVRQRNEIASLSGPRVNVDLAVHDSFAEFTVETMAATGLEDSIIAIIDNAIEASDITSPSVQVRCECSAGFASVSIVDFGCGIPAEILPRLMKERATFGKDDGNGLGLYHAAGVLKKLSGRIEIHSKLGSGTTVSLLVPRLIGLTENLVAYETTNTNQRRFV